MKGPHFFEKRKKEMARQQKAKEKADRKAQRKAGKGGEGDEFLDADGVELDADAQDGEGETTIEPTTDAAGENAKPPTSDTQSHPEHAPAVGAVPGNHGG